MRWADPVAFLLLPLVALDLWWRWPRTARLPAGSLSLSPLPGRASPPPSRRARWTALPVLLHSLALALVVVALARPKTPGEVRDTRVSGRNIVLTLDISSSMKALDFKTGNRLEAAKHAVSQFIERRQGDFLGLVVFAGRVFTQAPLTNSTATLLQLLDRSDIGMLPDGTAIGTALASAENKLKDLPRGSGVIVLITDGGNNAGTPDPLTAAEIARALGIRIYTVGVSSHGATPIAPYETGRPATMEAPTPLSTAEERLLRRVAEATGGRYFRAADQPAMNAVMDEIDKLERTERQLTEVRSWREWFPFIIGPALLLLLLEIGLGSTWLRTLP